MAHMEKSYLIFSHTIGVLLTTLRDVYLSKKGKLECIHLLSPRFSTYYQQLGEENCSMHCPKGRLHVKILPLGSNRDRHYYLVTCCQVLIETYWYFLFFLTKIHPL